MDLSADFIFTTEKDYVRIAHKIKWPIDLVVIGIEISFGKNDIDFKSFIERRFQGLLTPIFTGLITARILP